MCLSVLPKTIHQINFRLGGFIVWDLSVCSAFLEACLPVSDASMFPPLLGITIRGKWMLHQWFYENVWVGWHVASCTVVVVFVLSLLFPCLCFPPSRPCAVCFYDPLCFGLFLFEFMSYFASRFILIDPFLMIPAWILLPAFINSYRFYFSFVIPARWSDHMYKTLFSAFTVCFQLQLHITVEKSFYAAWPASKGS